ncbi:protocadherin-11 X-linked [Elysia marginata]|uniref:Protocadherin-11 X-linked n=1 Tax=Elysia marginata TaxID=1093978 RepID=A0AAV4GS64_9GAST|nr:protocadherin-11 X-linked [Elysia marginata]
MSLMMKKKKNLPCSYSMPSKKFSKSVVIDMRSAKGITSRHSIVAALLLLLTLATATHAQSLRIEKTIKEELLPGSVVAELMKEPELKTLLEGAKTVASGNGTLHFSVLTSTNPRADYFSAEPTKGVISIRRRLDRETVCSFRRECVLDFEVAVRSVLGSFFHIIHFAVTVLDVNDNSPEFNEPRFELNVPEESDAGRKFPLPTAFDQDTGPGNGVKDYLLLKGPPMFDLITEQTVLNTTDVFLTLDSVVNREKSESYKILVGAVDGGVPSLTGTLTVEVKISDINDNFPVFNQSVYIATVPEDFGRDQPVQTVKATDADSGANGDLLYKFSPMQPFENLLFFSIDANTGSIFLTRPIESRTGQRIELIVMASDKGYPPKTANAKVEIFVEDTVNSMPVIIADALGGANGVAEVSEYAQPGKVVAHVSVTDPDSGPNGETSCGLSAPEFQLESLGGSGGGKFTAVLKAPLDRETTDHYDVIVTCRDSGVPALVATGQFAVRVLDENDKDPVFEPRVYEVNIFENNTIGTSIVELSATDGDIGKNAELTFDVAGINSKKFSVDSDGFMTALLPLDREDSQRIVVTVLAADGGIPSRSATATVVINLLDINDCRPEFDRDVFEFSVEEGTRVGHFVGIVSASDQDDGTNQRLFYHFPLKGQSSRLFHMDLDGGIISTGAVLDREESAMHTVLVLATDRGNPPLTGTATVVVKVLDVNDNDPVFEFPLATTETGWENDSLSIPHSCDPAKPLATVKARDKDEGLNAQIVYTLSSINYSAPFSMNPSTGAISLDGELSPDDVGLYIMTVAATDQGPKQQRATQAPLYIDVFFDNSTLLLGAGNVHGPSQALVLGIVISLIVLVLACLLAVVFVVCFRRSRTHRKLNGGVPNSVSTSSTAKLQGGYYIAPGVRGSSDSILASKHSSHTGTYNSAVSPGGDSSVTTPLTNGTDEADGGMRTANPYVVILPRSESVAPSEIIEISRTGRQAANLNDTSDNLDNAEDATMFSTFKSEEDILAPGFRSGSLRRPSHDASSIAKRSAANDTFDDLSNDDDSTSDSGRGGSEVDINNGAAAANKERARAMAATPVSMKSGISNRLSPLPQGLESDYSQRTFVTFRGESPNSFRFDSDSDTLTRRRGRIPNSPGFPTSPAQFQPDGDSDAATSPTAMMPPLSFRRFDFSGPPRRLSESDGTDSELGAAAAVPPPRGRFQNMRRPLFPSSSIPNSSTPLYPNPQHIAGIYTPNVPSASHLNGYNSGGEGGPLTSSFLPGRQPFRVTPLLPMYAPPSSNEHRPESESDAQLSDSSGSTNPTNRFRSNHVPRLPYYPGMEFSHHAYGGSNRNSIGAFSNNSALSNTEPPYQYYQDQTNPTRSVGDYQPRARALTSSTSSNGGGSDPLRNAGPDARVSVNYGNVVSELQTSRPVSMEADFLLPPYPDADGSPGTGDGNDGDDDEDNQLHVHSGYTGFSPHRDSEREALFSHSKLESSA